MCGIQRKTKTTMHPRKLQSTVVSVASRYIQNPIRRSECGGRVEKLNGLTDCERGKLLVLQHISPTSRCPLPQIYSFSFQNTSSKLHPIQQSKQCRTTTKTLFSSLSLPSSAYTGKPTHRSNALQTCARSNRARLLPWCPAWLTRKVSCKAQVELCA